MKVAGSGGEALNVEEVFSTYLYKGTDANNITATTGIDMSGEGGMVWFKGRSAIEESTIVDSARGLDYAHYITQTNAHFSISGIGFSAPTFTSTGFTVGDMPVINRNTTDDYVAWSFRKAPKFFDVITYTGDGTSSQTISHNLGTTVGMIVVKRYDTSGEDWEVYHRGVTFNASNRLRLNKTNALITGSGTFASAPTSTEFYVGPDSGTNASGGSYVAYLFAHNDGDGDFGDGTQDIIKCGSYTGNGSSDGPEIDLGFEPQWLMFKRATGVENWIMFDNMRGMVVGGIDPDLRPDLSQAEGAFVNYLEPNPTGFKLTNANSRTNENGDTYIYMAIRRGPMAVPESGTDVFAIDTYDAPPLPTFKSSFVTDMALYKHSTLSQDWKAVTRLLGATRLTPNATTAETGEGDVTWDFMDGWYKNTGTASTVYSWMWRRAPSFCDVVAYSGNGSTQNVSHNLGVVPEMMWIKTRNAAGTEWKVYHSAIGNNKELILNSTAASGTASSFNNTTPTSSVFSVSGGATNDGAYNFIAYLFATLDGVSKVGSYSGNSSSQTIDCGFTSGARFVLIKASSRSGSWAAWDSERGITAGDDPRLELNNTNAEQSQSNIDVEPHNSGFIIDSTSGEFNETGETYIFYAIA